MATKKKISKEELRKAMLEAKKKHSAIKKIESPLARYNELDQLTCIVCKLVVRNEAVWPVHLNSKTHKDNIAIARESKFKTPAQTITSSKRQSTFQEPQPHKKIKGILKNTGQPSLSVNDSLPADFFDSSVVTKNSTTVIGTNSLNFTNGTKGATSVEEKGNEGKDGKDSINQSTIPEGFFDDPIQDAKARNVEYRDPNDEEWERFQREIKEESAQSAQIIGDDQEEAATERQLDVIEEQLRNWSRVMEIVKLKEKRVKTVEKKQDNDDSSDEEEDYDEFLDWRAKSSHHK